MGNKNRVRTHAWRCSSRWRRTAGVPRCSSESSWCPRVQVMMLLCQRVRPGICWQRHLSLHEWVSLQFWVTGSRPKLHQTATNTSSAALIDRLHFKSLSFHCQREKRADTINTDEKQMGSCHSKRHHCLSSKVLVGLTDRLWKNFVQRTIKMV